MNFPGKKLSGRYIVIESDDWGAIRIPNVHVREKLLQEKCISKSNPFSTTDTLESADDLYFLQKSLNQVKDTEGNHPIITANYVMGNPDFIKIREHNFDRFSLETSNQTYQRYFPSVNVFELLKEQINSKYIYPQFHAKEHLNAKQWLAELQTNNQSFLKGFDSEVFSVDSIPRNGKRGNVQATYDFHDSIDLEDIKFGISEGLSMFEESFGFKSRTTIAPCYVWNEIVEDCFHSKGVFGIQSSKTQQKPVLGQNSYKKVWHYHGEINKNKQTYWIRNVLFEPAVYPKVDWVNAAKQSISIAFKHQKPAVFGMHRINFVDGLMPGNREKSLRMLILVLSWALKTYPDVKFISSEQLLNLFQDKN